MKNMIFIFQRNELFTCGWTLYSIKAFNPPNLVPFDGSSTLQLKGGILALIDQQTPPSRSLNLNKEK
jgi:hypothetical protein